MKRRLELAIVALASLNLTNSAGAKPADEPMPPPQTPADQSTPTSALTGPLVAYVKHTPPPYVFDESSTGWAFGAIGMASDVASGHEIAEKDGIEDPGTGVAREIAAAYAAAQGGRLVDAPVLSSHGRGQPRDSPESLAELAKGARYVVDADPTAISISDFRFDWTHYDLDYIDAVRIIDTSDDKVVASARCSIKSEPSAGLPTHAELLADGGARLKDLIAKKSQACLAKLRNDLKL